MCNIVLGTVGIPQIILIVAVLILFFGAKKIPELMKGLGSGIKEFKKAVNDEEPKKENKDQDLIS